MMATEVNQTFFAWSQGESTERDGSQVSFLTRSGQLTSLFNLFFFSCEISLFKEQKNYKIIHR
jgi:hypothetical protein